MIEILGAVKVVSIVVAGVGVVMIYLGDGFKNITSKSTNKLEKAVLGFVGLGCARTIVDIISVFL